MADLRIVDAPEIPTNSITGQEKIPTGGSGNYSITLDSVADYTKTKKDLADNTSVDGKVGGVRQELDAHIEDLLNPHQVTKSQIGLGNVDNTADADKPVSNSTQAAIISAVAPKADKTYVDTALSGKAEKTYVDNQLTFKANKADVYTKSETYTKQESSDLVSNSISTALTPVNSSLDLAKRGVANRYDPSLTYNSGERVVLTNGDIVKSTIDGNANDPNSDMNGWVKTNSASQIFDASGRTQQEINSNSTFVVNPSSDANFKAELQYAVSNYKSVLIRGTHEIDLSDAVAVVPADGCSIHFDPNAKITVKPNNLERYYLFDLDGVSDVHFWSPHCIGDKDTHTGTTGQWGHCFNLMNCENINIYYPKLYKFWGDGIYVNGAKNTKVFNPKLSGNRRQGMSIIKCQELDVYFADISDTGGQDPAYGVDLEINWAGEHCTGIRFHNPTFRNNGQGGSYRAGFCISTHRARYVESGGAIPITNVEVELYNPKFYGDALIITSHIDQVHGYFKCYSPEFYNSNLSALLFLNHQSRNFFTEIRNPKFYDCVQANPATIYENVMQFESGTGDVVQTNGTCNIKIVEPEFYASDAAVYKTFAIRNLTKNTYTEDLKNVGITDVKFHGYSTPFTLANGTSINTPDTTFKLSYKDSSGYANLDHAANISNILDRTRLEFRGTLLQPVCFLNEIIPVSNTEFCIKNNGSSALAALTIKFGTSTSPTTKVVTGLSGGVSVDGIVLEKGAEVALIKKSADTFAVVGTTGRVLTTTQKGVSVTYDPPEIAAASSVTTTVALQGVVVGNPIVASFNRYNLNLELSAIVNAENTVTVKFKNTGTSLLDLPSGTLTVKAI